MRQAVVLVKKGINPFAQHFDTFFTLKCEQKMRKGGYNQSIPPSSGGEGFGVLSAATTVR